MTDLHKVEVKKAILCCKLSMPEDVDVLSAFISGDGNYGMSGLPGWNYQGELEKQKLVWRLLPAK